MAMSKNSLKELFFTITLFFAGIFAIALSYTNNFLLSLLLIVIGAIGIKIWPKKNDIPFFVTGAVLGPLAEIICVHFGVWKYTNPTFLGIPLWLPLAWGFATMLFKRIAEIARK